MRHLVVTTAMFAAACGGTSKPPGEVADEATHEEAEAVPTTPAGEAAPTVAVGSGVVMPGPCARIGDQPWRCLDPALPLASRPEVVAVAGWMSGNLCMLDTGGRLECLFKGKLEHSYENIDDFELAGSELMVATGGRRASTSFVGTGELRPSETAIDGAIVEIASAGGCNRTREGVLDCFREHLEGVDEFCTGTDYFCALVGEQVLCGGRNRSGQLGPGHRAMVNEPVSPVGLPPAVHVSCVDEGACALTRAGEVWCWGEDERGALGHPPWIEDGSTPRVIQGLRGAVGFDLLGSYGCAVLAEGELRCWGALPEVVPRAAQLSGPDECFAGDLDTWKVGLESAEPGAATSERLAQLGLARRWLLWPKTSGTLALKTVDLLEVELDGRAPSERLVAAHLATSEEDRCLVVALRTDEEGRWCAIADEPSFDRPLDRSPALAWPEDPGFSAPCRVRALELTEAGRDAIEFVEGGGDQAVGEAAVYALRYFELRGDQLVEVFGPFPLFEQIDGAPAEIGRVTLGGTFPKSIEAETSTDCSGFRGRCRAKTTTRSWIFDGEAYR